MAPVPELRNHPPSSLENTNYSSRACHGCLAGLLVEQTNCPIPSPLSLCCPSTQEPYLYEQQGLLEALRLWEPAGNTQKQVLPVNLRHGAVCLLLITHLPFLISAQGQARIERLTLKSPGERSTAEGVHLDARDHRRW